MKLLYLLVLTISFNICAISEQDRKLYKDLAEVFMKAGDIFAKYGKMIKDINPDAAEAYALIALEWYKEAGYYDGLSEQ